MTTLRHNDTRAGTTKLLYGAAVVAWSWVSAVAAKLRSEI